KRYFFILEVPRSMLRKGFSGVFVSLEGKGFLGIDESNHGRFPEIFVGVYSLYECDTKPVYSLDESMEVINKKKLPKIKKKNEGGKKEEIADILEKRKFKHILLLQEHKDRFGFEGVRAIAYAEIIKGFGNLELVLIDREIGDYLREDIAKILYPQRLPQITAESNADHRYLIVNKADQIARKLFRYYQPFKNERDYAKYSEHLISPMKSIDYLPIIG
ncbi:MAG TPA: hypothetical protein VJ461_02650, partial [Candidatus Nanoarchaeia archaeon]|nr:hypothetical protein [Candidatus Nanoarchaeia archaeon]